jgi:hypothetical protein
MLSSKILCVQEGQLDKENFGISKLITLLYSDGILAIIATFPTWLSRLKALSASVSRSTLQTATETSRHGSSVLCRMGSL